MMKHLLLMESDPIQAWLVSSLLGDAGFAVTVTDCAVAALKACKRELFDLALINSGGELEQQLLFCHLLPTLVITGRRSVDLEREAGHYAATPVLQKPFTGGQLRRAVAACL